MRFATAAIILIYFLCSGNLSTAQTLSQKLKGKVTDKLSNQPIEGANITLVNTSPLLGASSNKNGEFFIENVPVGRYHVIVQHIAYASVNLFDIQVISAKESYLPVVLTTQSQLVETVDINAPFEPVNMLSIHSFTSEEINRYAATFNDPARLSSSLAGTTTPNDQSNHIVVHGNSPNANAWYLNGLPIANPNHLSNAGTFSDQPSTSGGGVNVLSSQLLSTSNFYKNNYPLHFSNALGGVYDMHFRSGNKQENNYSIQAGAIGLEASTEGPFNKNKRSSYLANYRYSTLGLLTEAGIDFGNEEINYTDLSFNLNFESDSSNREINVFGLFGTSKNNLDFLPNDETIESDKDLQKINYDDLNFAFGTAYNKSYSKSKLEIGLIGSLYNANRNATITLNKFNPLRQENFEKKIANLSISGIYSHKLSTKTIVNLGLIITKTDNEIDYNVQFPDTANSLFLVAGTNNDKVNTSFIFLEHWLHSKIKIGLGLQSIMQRTNHDFRSKAFPSDSLNKETTSNSEPINPKVNIDYFLNNKQIISLNYQKSNKTIDPEVLYAMPDYLSSNHTVNNGLKPIRGHFASINYINYISSSWILKAQGYLQLLENVPIVNNENRVFSLLNNQEEIITDTLVNKGTGDNYGVDFSMQKQFYNNFYALTNLSIYRSTFEDAAGKLRSTKFDGKYIFNATSGYEKARKKNKNSFININARLFIQGGYRHTPIDIVASEQAKKTIFIESKTNSLQYPDYFRMDAGIRFIKNKERATRTWSIDVQNITNNKNIAYKYYDIYFKEIKTKYQLEIIPVFNYKIEF